MTNRLWDWLKHQFTYQNSSTDQRACFWQTDLHSHLIPGIDDGVKVLEESMQCIRQLADWGIQKVITTPHVSHERYPNDSATILQGLKTLKQQVELEQLPVVIDVAAEYMLDDFFLQRLEAGPLLAFGPERYLLVETGWLARPLFLDEIIFRIQTAGYVPVLAHPERYPYYMHDPEGLAKLRDQGCLMQLNWMSLTGRYGAHTRTQAKLILKNNWVDFIGSDLHRPEDLPALQALFSSSFYDSLKAQPLRNKGL
ncbi:MULTISPECIES: CpsB/CapC family capsule biosynthesis tyrosine phosphatase [unclassified Spirosoma]|uniref:tyrosine-protein phosphatase n=1 Tax=unclassified Spirosoma TaxID=2621999 RepID=UPI000967C38E|nr:MULTISPECIES: CpsB/CapC family capsule biosynthesis tyrosine phosphatase [unclassified Spirosoma]OJW76161.1 MAG: histidinol-phosphatase [Spirosoma sp. 48-14]